MGFDTAQMEKADVVHLHWIGGRTVDFSQLCHIRRPLVYTLHDMFACTAGCHCTMDCGLFQDECRGNCPQLGAPRLFRNIPAWLFSRKRRAFGRIPSLTLVTPSLWLKREVERSCMFPGRKIVQIYNPVDTDLFRPAEDRNAIRAGLGIPPGAFVIGLRRNRPVQSGQRRPFHPPGAGGTIPARAPEPSSPALRQPRKKRGLPLPQHKRRIHYGHEQAGRALQRGGHFPEPHASGCPFQRSAGIHGLQNPFRYLPDGRSSGSGSGRKDGAGRSAGGPEPNGRPLRTGSSRTENSCKPWRRKAVGTRNKHSPTPSLPHGTPPCMRKRSGNTVTKSENGRRSTAGLPVPVHQDASSFVIDKKKTPHTLCTVSTLLPP